MFAGKASSHCLDPTLGGIRTEIKKATNKRLLVAFFLEGCVEGCDKPADAFMPGAIASA